ncbi:hypothetical protein EVAR_66706_1 [Eumeta japonica]|uniref:YqaJ viral recombinase domain-containing protein n=1 Tax=Eumeta variegata TaxID=151549 RepID=A0A4C1ZMW4_EUMVA|nr:hypothetical protein EVAR_66706_1 [Eumeta japonica]
MAGIIPDTPAMKWGRMLGTEVRKTVSIMLGKKIKKCGLMPSQEYPMIAGSPDRICEDSIIEIKCPTSAVTYQNYVKNDEPTEKFNMWMQMQMYLTGLQEGKFFFLLRRGGGKKCITHSRVPVHAASPDAAGRHAGVPTARDMHYGRFLWESSRLHSSYLARKRPGGVRDL